MGILAFIPAILFFVVWLTNSRMDKGAFGGPVWWHNTRLVHSIMILLFAISATIGNSDSWQYLAADATLGLGFFTAHKTGYM